MHIATSSYRQFRPSMGQPVAISLTRPAWHPQAADWPGLAMLTPRWSYFRADPEQFRESYLAQLARYGVTEITGRLEEIGQEFGADRVVLICHESKEPVTAATCHRRIFAEWWLSNAGNDIPEAP